ncbi:hypothetical protein [Adlercreutzia sp. ZJ154]|nr:hypothetical protein [Adlercreutzia sp. ZJ154]
MKREDAMDVLEEYVPGVKENPKLKLGASMPIDMLAKMAPDMLPPDKIPELDAALQKLPD